MSRTDLISEQWERLKPFLPPEHRGKRGRPYVSHRRVQSGILWRLRTGAPWPDLPTRYGSFQTCADRLARWTRTGVWQHILQELQADADANGQIDWQTGCADGTVIRAHQHAAGAKHAERLGPPSPSGEGESATEVDWAGSQALGYSQGGFSTKIHLVAAGHGRPLAATLSPGQSHESQQLAACLDAVNVPRRGRGRPRKRPVWLLLDRGYAGKPCRQTLHQRRIRALIPSKSNQLRRRKRLGQKGGRPPYWNKEQYAQRNVVERCFNRLKHWRAVATRYDKLASHFLAGLTIAMIMLWLN